MKPESENIEQEPQEPGEREPGAEGGADSGAAEVDQQIQELRERIAQLEDEKAQLNQDKLRTIADYQNFARRAAASEREAKLQGITAIVLNVIPVLDHFDLALGQDPAKVTADQIVSGVKVIRDELLKVLQRHGVNLIEPKPNDEFDPTKHQAVLQQQDEAIEPGHIVQTLQMGYALNDRAIRPASVSVRPTE
jgi:molecular chaperone GrpE